MATGEGNFSDVARDNEVNDEIKHKFQLPEFLSLRLPNRIKSITKTNMFVMMETSKAVLAAAMETDHGLLRDLALEHLQVLEYINRCMPNDNRIEIPSDKVGGDDIADSIHALMREHKAFAEILKRKGLFHEEKNEPANSQNVCEVKVTEEEDAEDLPLATKSATLAVEEAEEAAIRAPAQPLPERNVEDLANVQAPSLAVPGTPLAVAQDEDPGVETTEVQGKAGAEQQAEERENYTDKNKNRRRQCPMCTFFGTHLDRHIRAKHNDTSKNQRQKSKG